MKRIFLIVLDSCGIGEEPDAAEFGGTDVRNTGVYKTEKCLLRNYGNAIRIRVPAMSAVMFRCIHKNPVRKKKPGTPKAKPKQ